MSGKSWAEGNSRMHPETILRMEEIIRLHQKGLSQAAIGKEIHISQGVVSQYLTRARKTGMLDDSSRYTTPGELTAHRLEVHLEKWHGKFTMTEREAVSMVVGALRRISE